MGKRGSMAMWIVALVVLVIAAVVVFFKLPYSKTLSEFQETAGSKIKNTAHFSDIFSESDLQGLPSPLKKYFKYCGYPGTPKMSYMKASFKNVDFVMSENKTIKIDYVQYNFVEKPDRFAYIKSSLSGIPFEGFDSYQDGVGSMKGTIAKLITLFDQRGEDMDRSCLVTVLAESLVVPNAALQDYIKWEEIDDTHAKATISWNGISASGIFTFDEQGRVLYFKTGDRVATGMDGSKREVEWSAVYSNYKNVNGLNQPTVLQSIWHYPEGDSVYFNENRAEVSIEYY